jgi:signal transduction histidine kinase
MQWFIIAFIIGYFAAVDFLAAYGYAVYPFGYLPVLGFLVIAALTIKNYHLVDITPAFAAGQIIDIMNDALVVLDAEGLIQFMNRSAAGIFGQGKGRFDTILGCLRRGEVLRDHEEIFEGSGGIRRTLSFSASVMTDDGKRPVAYVLIAHDVTARKESDRALLEKSLELERSRAELGQLELFSFVASHDLQEPLGKITTFSGRLRTEIKDALTEKGREYLERMEGAVERMSRYLSDIVEFSRVGAKTDDFEPVRLDVVVQEVLADLELRISELSAKVEVKPLPTVRGDRFQMRQLFQNLIVNALKFHRPGEHPVVRIASDGVHDGFVRISVEDEGIGLDEKYTEKIFAPFERLHGRDEYEGSGMGLAICKRIVTRHGGRIQVRSTLGHGSLFLVDLTAAV